MTRRIQCVTIRLHSQKGETIWLQIPRKDNIIYYGSMADPYIVMMQILETKKVGDEDVASRVSVQLQLTDPNVKARDRVTKRTEKDGVFSALDVGSVWLERALSK